MISVTPEKCMIASDDVVASWLCTLDICGYNGIWQSWQPCSVQTENYESNGGYNRLIGSTITFMVAG